MRHFNAGKKIDYRKFAVFVFRPGAETYPLPFRKPGGLFLKDPTIHSPLLLPLRKEVIQPHLPIRLPCYDFTPVANPTFCSALLAVRLLTSGITGSHGATVGVYKARERIHRCMLIRDY